MADRGDAQYAHDRRRMRHGSRIDLMATHEHCYELSKDVLHTRSEPPLPRPDINRILPTCIDRLVQANARLPGSSRSYTSAAMPLHDLSGRIALMARIGCIDEGPHVLQNTFGQRFSSSVSTAANPTVPQK